MRIPVPTNRLVAFTLAGALLTMVVAAGLAVPGFGPTAQSTGDTSGTDAGPDAPQPNENFTPDVQTGAEYEDGDDEYEDEEHEYEEDEEYEDGEESEEEEHEEYEEEEYEED